MQSVERQNRKMLVVGLGKTGLSCVRYLSAQGFEVAVTDSREQPPGLDALRAELPDVAVFLGGFDEQIFGYAQELVVSPGVSIKESVIANAMARGVPVVGDIELFARAARAPIVAITGSNGKSTVTSIVGAMARAAGRDARIGGNLGIPALDLLRETEPDLYVLELSSFQLETTHSLNAAAAVVLNISPDHMDRYADVAEYAQTKQRVYHGNGTMVLNADDPAVIAMACQGRKRILFGLGEPAGSDDFGLRRQGDAHWLAKGREMLMPESELLIRGRHNVANALAALALGDAVGLPMTGMLEALRTFPGLAHRSQWIAEDHGVQWYDDSKGTNVGATIAAVQGMAGPVILIAGGDGKGADFSPLRTALPGKVRTAILIGRDAPQIENVLQGAVNTVRAADMEDAVMQARALAKPGDTVLLSPACASFDMFKNYEERGDAFTQAVRRLLGL